jgi:hypothetical protein
VLRLTLAILYHVGLGVLLAGIVWSVGYAWLLALWRRSPPPSPVFAYPVGLLAILVACALFLTNRWLGLPAAALLVAPLGLAAREALPPALPVRRAAASVAWALPAVVGLGATIGFFLHGPTRRVDSNAFGDVVWYAAKLASAKRSLFPLHDLSAAGVDLWRAELGPTLVGATISYLPGTDPFLFHTSLLPAFLGASLCVGFTLTGGSLAEPRLRLALLAVGMAAYPSWLAESPPVTLALPLAFSIFALLDERLPKRQLALLLAVVAADLALTKGLVLVPLAILGAFALRRHRLTRRERLGVAIAVPVAVAAVLAATLANSWWVLKAADLHFQPLTAYRGLREQLDTRSTIRLAPALQLAGYLLLGLVLWRRRATALLAALAVCLLWSWTILEYSIEIGLGTIVLLTVLELRRRPPPPADDLLLAAAAACLALGAWFRDFGGIRAALAESACLAAVVLSGLVSTAEPDRRRLLAFHLRLYAVAGAVALLALSGHALVAGLAVLAGAAAYGAARPPRRAVSFAAAGLLALGCAAAVRAGDTDDLRLGTYDTTLLTRDHYAVWHRVAEVVPDDALVFTDETGPNVAAAEGQNYYPAVAGRQVYLAGWYQSRLREDDRDRERRLRLNELVLDGRVSPHAADPARRYGAYYAVAREGPHPASFRRLYASGRLALYRITT